MSGVMSSSAGYLLLLVLGLLFSAEIGSAARHGGPHGYERHRKTHPDPAPDGSLKERTIWDQQHLAEYEVAMALGEREEPSEYRVVRRYKTEEPSENLRSKYLSNSKKAVDEKGRPFLAKRASGSQSTARTTARPATTPKPTTSTPRPTTSITRPTTHPTTQTTWPWFTSHSTSSTSTSSGQAGKRCSVQVLLSFDSQRSFDISFNTN